MDHTGNYRGSQHGRSTVSRREFKHLLSSGSPRQTSLEIEYDRLNLHALKVVYDVSAGRQIGQGSYK
jgi:hypothetical protein